MYSQVKTEKINHAFQAKDYKEVIDLFEKSGVKAIHTDVGILDKISKSYYFIQEYQKSLPLSIIVLEVYQKLKKADEAYAAAYYVSRNYLYSNIVDNRLDSARYYSEISLLEAKSSNNSISIGSASNNLAYILKLEGKYTEAIGLLELAEKELATDSIRLMSIRANRAYNYFRLGILDSALKINNEAYLYFKSEQNSPHWQWLTTFRMGYIEKRMKNRNALEYFRESLPLANTLENESLSLSGIGVTMLENSNDSAEYYLNSAYNIAKDLKQKSNIIEINLNRSALYGKKKDLERMKSIIDEGENIAIETDAMLGFSSFMISKSEYFLLINDFLESVKYANIAIDTTRKYDLRTNLVDALSQKYRVLNHFGYYKEALEVKEEEIKVQQELFNDRSEAVYQILRTQNEMDKQESTIANQQLVIDNNNLQFTIMYISIALVISALIFIFWQYRTRSKYARKLETMFLDSRHRYMNNLLLLKNWFNEGKTESNDEIISFAQNRIDAISTVNRHLDRLSYNKDTIESKSFLEDISHNLLANREFTSEIENVPINMSVSGPLGMITNEIITNGLKYGEEPYAIRFHKNGKGYVLEIEDHGPGITDPEKKGTGSKVLRLLSRQLKGELKYQNKADHSPESRGTLVSLNFKG